MPPEADLGEETTRPMSCMLFLDLDDVLCLNEPFGGLHAHHAAYNPAQIPPDLYRNLFQREAVDSLNVVFDECNPRVVLTTSWLSLLQQPHFAELFRLTRLVRVGANFHPVWDAAADRGVSRLTAIDRWLALNHRGEPYLVLDDFESGESLIGSTHANAGRVVFCEVGRGFEAGHLPSVMRALRQPFMSQQRAR